jgi:hypothetical protein
MSKAETNSTHNTQNNVKHIDLGSGLYHSNMPPQPYVRKVVIRGGVQVGKTKTLIEMVKQSLGAGEKCLAIKFDIDNRFSSENKIISHNKIDKLDPETHHNLKIIIITQQTLLDFVQKDIEFYPEISGIDLIAIDEAQFANGDRILVDFADKLEKHQKNMTIIYSGFDTWGQKPGLGRVPSPVINMNHIMQCKSYIHTKNIINH